MSLYQQPRFVRSQFLVLTLLRERFSQTSFHGANLSSAKFNFANLSYVNFSSAICTQPDFNNSEVGYRARLAKAYFLAEQTIS
jgi:uncharacterized protein YjbI with pentapeptide repeats